MLLDGRWSLKFQGGFSEKAGGAPLDPLETGGERRVRARRAGQTAEQSLRQVADPGSAINLEFFQEGFVH